MKKIKNVKVKVMFDNGGGVHMQLCHGKSKYKHSYDDGIRAAEDYCQFLKDQDTSYWDGHDEELDIYSSNCPNGGHIINNQDDIIKLVNEYCKDEDMDFFGRNQREFITKIIELI